MPTVNSINGRYNYTSNLINEIYYNEQTAPTVKLKSMLNYGDVTTHENIYAEYSNEESCVSTIDGGAGVKTHLIDTSIKFDSTWVIVFGDDISNVARSVIETYDHGYIIGGNTKPVPPATGYIKEGLIIKTDINGEVLWQKIIGIDADNGVGSTQVVQTYDGGYILFSGTYKYGSNRNVMLMKLNACGEKEWNKIFISSYQSQWNKDVLQLADSTYLVMLSYWGSDAANERIWLFKISKAGDIIWQKVYANWNPSTNNEEGRHIVVNNENEYLITGDYYQHQPGGDTNARYLRPMFIKIDSLGNEIWHTLWGIDDFYIGWNTKAVNMPAFDWYYGNWDGTCGNNYYQGTYDAAIIIAQNTRGHFTEDPPVGQSWYFINIETIQVQNPLEQDGNGAYIYDNPYDFTIDNYKDFLIYYADDDTPPGLSDTVECIEYSNELQFYKQNYIDLTQGWIDEYNGKKFKECTYAGISYVVAESLKLKHVLETKIGTRYTIGTFDKEDISKY